VEKTLHSSGLIRFATFEVDLRTGELRKSGVRVKLVGQPFQVLGLLLERHGELVTREELESCLWPDTFVDADHSLNTAVNRLREVLGDSAENPRFVETVPRRGYRFIFPLSLDGIGANGNGSEAASRSTVVPEQNAPQEKHANSDSTSTTSWRRFRLVVALLAIVIGVAIPIAIVACHKFVRPPEQTLTRVTFDDGLQFGATWSPDARFLAYSSDRGGKLGIFVQQLGTGEPLEIAKGGDNWSPDWSPDGKYIVYRSEDGDGLFVVPVLGGDGFKRKVASAGYHPHWSPDGTQILFQSTEYSGLYSNRFYVVGLDGSAPRQVLADLATEQIGLSAAWHPDGKRISVWTCDPSSYSIWTQPLAGGPAIKSQLSSEISHQLNEVSFGGDIPESRDDYFFAWAPSGKSMYLEQTFRGAKNIWRAQVNPETLRPTSFTRLTTGPGGDTELALSKDGDKLAFTSETRQIRAWEFPFDAKGGRLKGAGRPFTPSGREAWQLSLSPDGKNFAYRAVRQGKFELWQRSLADGQETLIGDDHHYRNYPQWSSDGLRLAYFREDATSRERQLVYCSASTGEETPVSESKKLELLPYDWSPDGKSLLVSQRRSDRAKFEMWTFPVGRDREPQKIASTPDQDLFQGHFSPDSRWIAFESARSEKVESTIFVMPASGGPWIPITNGMQWGDKPRWSPDGKTLYFVSLQKGFYNVYGVHFDPAKGQVLGSMFRVTDFKSPAAMIPKEIMGVELAISRDRLIVNVEQLSGNIWSLDHLNH
jgi:Tol biopolymer transport system component/DNA-binding winged helix-turn-helix (wHTH) protein